MLYFLFNAMPSSSASIESSPKPSPKSGSESIMSSGEISSSDNDSMISFFNSFFNSIGLLYHDKDFSSKGNKVKYLDSFTRRGVCASIKVELKGGIVSKKLFVTATGTDIGKTFVSALIVKKMREAGLNCGYFKPVLSGVEEKDGKLTVSDCNYVVNKSKLPASADDCVAYWWKEAVSPHLAAKRAGEEISIPRICSKFKEVSQNFDYVLVEGAGGITCPLRLENGEKYLLKDLIKELDCSVIIVADGGLGTINSTLLTVEYARANNIKVKGIVLNNFKPDNFMQQDNLKQVEYLTGIRVVATVEKNQDDIVLLKDLFEE